MLMVAADAEASRDLTTEYLGRLRREAETMLAVCTKNYSEWTAFAYSSHKELILPWIVRGMSLYCHCDWRRLSPKTKRAKQKGQS